MHIESEDVVGYARDGLGVAVAGGGGVLQIAPDCVEEERAGAQDGSSTRCLRGLSTAVATH